MLFISWLLCIIVNVFKQATCYYYKEEQMLHLLWYIIHILLSLFSLQSTLECMLQFNDTGLQAF